MAKKQVAQETISKALSALQDLAKGHSSRGTATTDVESMRDGGKGAGSSAGATQVHHTSSNSSRDSWAGSSWKGSPEDGATDAIDENGTDYTGGAEMVKSILHKLSKGIPLTAEESAVYSAIAKGGNPFGKEEKDDDEDDKAEKAVSPTDVSMKAVAPSEAKSMKKDDDKDSMDKSLTDHAQANDVVQKGLELSGFLAGWAEVQNDSLNSVEGRILSQVRKSLSDVSDRQESFNGQLAKSVSQLAEVLSLQAQRIEQLESTPARGPKSQVTAVEKSFGAGGVAATQQGESLSKSDVLDSLVDLVQKGEVSATDVVAFESTSQLPAHLEQKVLAHRSGR